MIKIPGSFFKKINEIVKPNINEEFVYLKGFKMNVIGDVMEISFMHKKEDIFFSFIYFCAIENENSEMFSVFFDRLLIKQVLKDFSNICYDHEKNIFYDESGISISPSFFDKDHFEMVETSNSGFSGNVDSKMFSKIIKDSSIFVSKDKARVSLMTMNVVLNDEKFYSYATDGFKVLKNEIVIEDISGNPKGFYIPSEAFGYISKTLAKFQEEKIELRISDIDFKLVTRSYELSFSCPPGFKYPSIEALLNEKRPNEIVVDKYSLIRVCKFFPKSIYNKVFIKFSEDGFSIYAKIEVIDYLIAEIKTFFKFKNDYNVSNSINPSANCIAFSDFHLLPCLNVFDKSKSVIIKINKNNNSALISSNDQSEVVLLMPLHIG